MTHCQWVIDCYTHIDWHMTTLVSVIRTGTTKRTVFLTWTSFHSFVSLINTNTDALFILLNQDDLWPWDEFWPFLGGQVSLVLIIHIIAVTWSDTIWKLDSHFVVTFLVIKVSFEILNSSGHRLWLIQVVNISVWVIITSQRQIGCRQSLHPSIQFVWHGQLSIHSISSLIQLPLHVSTFALPTHFLKHWSSSFTHSSSQIFALSSSTHGNSSKMTS